MYALHDLGWTDSHTTEFEPHRTTGLLPARVSAQHRGAYVVLTELGELRAELAAPEHNIERIGDEVGDVLFMVASLSQHLGVEPEDALRKMLDRFGARFASMESSAARDGRELESLSPEEWAGYWNEAKTENT